MQAKDRLIFALDVNREDQVEYFMKELQGFVGCFKIGLELFTSLGPSIVEKVAKFVPVFLDLKIVDIPNTIKGVARVIGNMGATYSTIYGAAKYEGFKAAVEAAPKVKFLVVSALTSEERNQYTIPHMQCTNIIAKDAGIAGCICSGQEVRELKSHSTMSEDFLFVTPGIRPIPGAGDGDQKRVVTPYKAIMAGSDMMVVGRPIRTAKSPRIAAESIVSQIEMAMKELNK
jgi:orotidine-5'-phosphate decarboxylase